MIPYLIISILVVLILVVLAVIYFSRKSKLPPDYYSLFMMGLVWMPIGVVFDNYALTAMGVIFMIIGLVHKDKWKENRRDWKNMPDERRKLMIVVMVLLGVLVFAGLLLFFLR